MIVVAACWEYTFTPCTVCRSSERSRSPSRRIMEQSRLPPRSPSARFAPVPQTPHPSLAESAHRRRHRTRFAAPSLRHIPCEDFAPSTPASSVIGIDVCTILVACIGIIRRLADMSATLARPLVRSRAGTRSSASRARTRSHRPGSRSGHRPLHARQLFSELLLPQSIRLRGDTVLMMRYYNVER